jgi:uncharacterized membrane protein
MQLRALFWIDKLRTSFWFIPTVMALVAGGLSLATVALDHELKSDQLEGIGWLYGGGAEGARAVLSAVASSMITVAGVVFSIMMVVLSLAAQQYGPRLLRNFMRDRITQFVLGIFVATFLYCLMVLRTIRGQDGQQFVPQISVTVGVALALTSLGVLIYFIHHVSISIHIGEIISRVQEELLETIDSIFPEALGEGERDAAEATPAARLPEDFQREASAVLSDRAGFLQAFEEDDLLETATKRDLVVQTDVRPGDFILPRQAVMRAWPGSRVDDEIQDELRQAMLIGSQRTPVQDVLYALDQQTEIAVRALSPGINDPYTANNCLERLAEALCRLAARRMPSELRFDSENRLRVLARGASIRQMVASSLGRVREYGRMHATVTIKILEILSRLSARVRREGDLDALREQLDAVAADSYGELSPYDLARVRESEQQTRKRLDEAEGTKKGPRPA